MTSEQRSKAIELLASNPTIFPYDGRIKRQQSYCYWVSDALENYQAVLVYSSGRVTDVNSDPLSDEDLDKLDSVLVDRICDKVTAIEDFMDKSWGESDEQE